MNKYYTRACNFYYGYFSKKLVKKKLSLPLCGNHNISFDKVEIFSRGKRKIISKIVNLNQIKFLPNTIKKKFFLILKKLHQKENY